MSNILAKLMLNHPSLDILVQVDNNCLADFDGFSWGKLDARNCAITEVYRGKNNIYTEDLYEPYEIFEDEGGDLDDEEAFAEFLDRLDKSWEKVIIIYVDPLNEE